MKKFVAGLMGIASCALAVAATAPAATPPPASPTSAATKAPTAGPAKPAVTVELDQLVASINQKLKAGIKDPSALREDMRGFDEILFKYRDKGDSPQALAQVLFIKALLCVQVLKDFNEGGRVLRQLKQEFPTAPQSAQVDDMLAELKLPAEVQSVQKALKPGAIFPDFSEKDLNGAPLSISKFKGRPVLVVFWSTATTPFLKELPVLLALYEKYHPKGFEVIGVAMDEREFTLRSFLKGTNTPWPQYFDGQRWENKLAQKYGVITLPTTFLLDGNARIIAINLPLPAVEASLAGMLPK